MNIIDFGLHSRMIGITDVNLDSSRSYIILQIAIRIKDNNMKISYIDIAGSVDAIETNKQTKIDGTELIKVFLFFNIHFKY